MTDNIEDFDEVEDGTVLRTLVDWKLFDTENELVSLDALGEGKPCCSVTGRLVKPLPKSVRLKVVENLCTYGVHKDGTERKEVIVQEQLVKEHVEVEWDRVQVGDQLDGYCDKTCKWLKARVVDVIREPHARFKVHFNGWKSKHDEWLDIGSSRLAVPGQFTDIVMVDVVKPPLIPWYENSAIHGMIETECIPTATVDQEFKIITVNDIEDWCVDYSYANPSLWLISREGPWYRVVSPLIAGGAGALPDYRPIFDKYLEKIVAAAHCAYCLMDFLPYNRKLSFQNVVDEIDNRSGGRVDDYVLLVHASFIIEQLSDLTAHDSSLGKDIRIEDSFFMTQYRKRAEQYSNLKHEKKRRKREVCKSLMDKSCGGSIDFSVKDLPQRVKPKKLEPIVPIKDRDYWAMQREAGVDIIPFPAPDRSHQLLPADLSHLLGYVLEAWNILTNYRAYLSLPSLTLEALLNELRTESGNVFALGEALREIHLQLLLSVLLVPLHRGDEAADPVPSFACVQYSAEASDFSPSNHNGSKSSILWGSIHECCTSSSGDSREQVKQFLRRGDMWVEVIRALLHDSGEVVLPDYVDTVLEMQCIVEDLLLSPSYQSLRSNASSDTSHINHDTRYPITLDDILSAIKGGIYYEGGHYNSHRCTTSSESVMVMPKYFLKLKVGTKLDAFSATLRAWYSSQVIKLFPETGNVLIRFDGWGAGFDETFSVNDSGLAPFRSLSLNSQQKDIAPHLLPHEVFSTLEDKFRKAHAREATRPSDYCPHEAIARDIQRVLENAILASGAQDSNDILNDFQRSYNARVVNVIKIPEVTNSNADCTLQDVAIYLNEKSYCSAPLFMKIKILHWLCTTMVASGGAKLYLEDTIERRATQERASRVGSRANEGEGINSNPRTGRRRTAEAINDVLGNGKLKNLDYCNTSEISGIEDKFEVRIEPLGKDRDSRTYWRFCSDRDSECRPLRIFCEDRATERWNVFSGESDILLLLNWLSDYGINEVALKQQIKSIFAVTTTNSVAPSAVRSYNIKAPPVHARFIDVVLGPDGKLGAGVKDLNGKVIVSTYNMNEHSTSCAKDAGMLLCDQIISVNSHLIVDVPSLQEAMVQVKQSQGNCDNGVKVAFLILRYSFPEDSLPAVPLALKSDMDFKLHFQQQRRQQRDVSMTSSTREIEGRVVAEDVVGLMLEMLHNTASVCPALPGRDSFLGSRYFMDKISGILFSLRHVVSLDGEHYIERSTCNLLACLRECLLNMEYALSKSEFQIIAPTWHEKRRNLNWKLYCQKATTFSKLAVCIFALYQSIDWKEIMEINCIIDVSKVSNYVPKQIQSFVPRTGHRAIFFGDAFASGGDDPFLECWGDIPSATVACDVLSVKHYKGGSTKGRTPYAKVVLQVCGSDDRPGMSLQVLPPKNDSKRLNRLLNLVLFVLLASPESVPFSSAVSVKDCPNYYDIIATPMHLGEIQKKVTKCEYNKLSEFAHDIELIRSNCIRYCAETYPSLLPMVETLHATALDLSRRLIVNNTDNFCDSSAKEDSTSQSSVGSTFFISVPLNDAKYNSYLVPMDKYEKCISTKYRLEDTFHFYKKQPLTLVGETDDPPCTASKCKGVIVGCRASISSHSSYVPWKCLDVEWDEEEDAKCGLFDAVNPWDIVLE